MKRNRTYDLWFGGLPEYWQRLAAADAEKEEPADYDYESIKSGEEPNPFIDQTKWGDVEQEATKPASDQLGKTLSMLAVDFAASLSRPARLCTWGSDDGRAGA